MTLNERDIADILTRHGVPLDADEVVLAELLTDRGWQAQVEDPLTDDPRRGARARRYRALAFRRAPRDGQPDTFMMHEHRRATGDSPEAALRRVLAAVLEREAPPEAAFPPPPAYGDGLSPL